MSASWPLAKRIAFRFVFAYLVLYNLPFPLNILPFVDEPVSVATDQMWQKLALWLGAHVFHVAVVIQPTGSGDTMWNWLATFACLVIAVLVTIVWSVLDRRRTEYRTLFLWLRIYVRFSLAAILLSYGLGKVMPMQFGGMTMYRMMERIGDASPMGLVWTFMAASKPYTIFGGMMECIPAILLTMRRTTLLGALLAITVMTNVVMLNFCYDVPVKLYSTHILLMAVFLAVPDVHRLANVFLRNKPAPPNELPRVLPERWSRFAAPAARTLAVVVFVTWQVLHTWAGYRENHLNAKPSPFYGVWNADEFAVNGVVHPPLVTDASRWRFATFDYTMMAVELMDGSWIRGVTKLDEAKKTMTLRRSGKDGFTATLAYQRPAPDRLVLDGAIRGQQLHVVLHRSNRPMLLITRGFHWINEQPYNR